MRPPGKLCLVDALFETMPRRRKPPPATASDEHTTNVGDCAQCTAYELNQNDCRHYVNALCRFATGVEYASSRVVRDVLQRKRMRSSAHRWVVRSALHLMDVQTQVRSQTPSRRGCPSS
jgi:hypothetical protein